MGLRVGSLIFIVEGKPFGNGLDWCHVGKVAKGNIEVKSEVLEDYFHFLDSLVVFGVKEINKYIVLSS